MATMMLYALVVLAFCMIDGIQLVEALASLPIDPKGWPDRFPAKEHCSRCGLCETTFVSNVKDACAFLGKGMARMDVAEVTVHGRPRDLSLSLSSFAAEEARFGVMRQPMRLAKGINISNAQWTGVVTSIALSMLESGMVDSVVCIANNNNDGDVDNVQKNAWSYPKPILAKTSEDILRGRGVKPALAPSLQVLDDITKDKSIRKLLFCGVGSPWVCCSR
jgi:coenzyme F420-reducing hydrogenase beta subunit